MRALTTEQSAALDKRATRPVYLIELFIGGQEFLSTNGDQLVGLQSYFGSDIGLTAIDNWQSATIKLLPTSARVAQLTSQQWRHGLCKVSMLPVVEYPLLYPPGYMQDGYAIQGVSSSEPILLIDGELTGASFSGDLCSFTVSHKVTVGRWLPALRIDPPLCNHLPRPGEVLVWEGEKFTLEAR